MSFFIMVHDAENSERCAIKINPELISTVRPWKDPGVPDCRARIAVWGEAIYTVESVRMIETMVRKLKNRPMSLLSYLEANNQIRQSIKRACDQMEADEVGRRIEEHTTPKTQEMCVTLCCPMCHHTWEPRRHDDMDRVFAEGEHEVVCGECSAEFTVSTRVSFHFTSPEMTDDST